jgi:flagellar basal-body rod modification protein FlgD
MISPVGSSGNATSTPAGTATSAVAGGAMGKDAFMKLLVAQMRHQDPLKPSDGTAMAAQLAQFSSLEQLINIGDLLRTQGAEPTGLTAAIERSSALAMIGKTAVVEDNGITVGDNATPWASTTIEGGGALSLRVVDSTGRTVATHQVGVVAAGTQRVALDTVTKDLPAGRYHVEFDLKSGATVSHPATAVPVTVDGIGLQNGAIVVTSDGRAYPLTAVQSVTARP